VSVAIIINPLSGGATSAQARARAQLASDVVAKSGQKGDVFVTERRGHARELAAGAAKRGARLVIAWGGDGTVNEVASALVFGPTALGIVPSGSGNGLARELNISRRPAQAIAEALAAAPRAIESADACFSISPDWVLTRTLPPVSIAIRAGVVVFARTRVSPRAKCFAIRRGPIALMASTSTAPCS
jgi:diacylglycerol kinase family enzyme